MALEPITRQEQIVAGKKLEPITRMERFLKDYGVSNYFGETTVMGDTLTWDGNTEGLVTVEIPNAGGALMVKLSDAMPTVADMPNGVTEVLSNGTQSTRTQEEIQSAVEQLGVVSGDGFWVFPEDNYSFMGMMTIPKAGLYVSRMEGAPYHTSLTIPGYKGFETTTIKPLDEKYLPESVKGGGGGATKWDDLGTAGYLDQQVLYVGDLEVDADAGSALVQKPFNFVPGKEYEVYFLTSGMTSSDRKDYKCIAEPIYMEGIEMGVAIGNTSALGGTIESEAPFVVVVVAEAFKTQIGAHGFVMPLNGDTQIVALHIDGPVEVVNPIPERYLPEKFQNFGSVFFYAGTVGEVESGSYLYKSADTTNAANRATREEVLSFVHSGRAIYLVSSSGNGSVLYFPAVCFTDHEFGYMVVSFGFGDQILVCYTAENT